MTLLRYRACALVQRNHRRQPIASLLPGIVDDMCGQLGKRIPRDTVAGSEALPALTLQELTWLPNSASGAAKGTR